MTIAWMLYVLLVGALLSIGAWGVEDALRYAKLPTRWVWAAAMLATVAFAVYALRNTPATVSAMPQVAATVATSTDATAAPSSTSMSAVLETLRGMVGTSIAAATARVPASMVRWTLIAWAVASGVLLLVHVAVNRRVLRQRRTWPLATLPGGTVRVAPTLGPAVVGLASPEIIVPRWLLEKTGEEQRLVMVHEQEHIAARDQYVPVIGLLVASLLPWHPAVWWSLARLRLAVELDCDSRVLRRGIHARSYGSLLIDIAGQCAGHQTGALALADRPSHLERRLRAMTHRTSRFILVRTIGLVAVAGLAVITACEARLPTSAEVQAMDVTAAEKSLVQFKVIDDHAAANAVYVVDGQPVTAEKAHSIPANRIATVNIIKSSEKGDGTKSTIISIATLGAPTREQLALRSDTAGPHWKVMSDRNVAPPLPPQRDAMPARSKTPFTGLVLVDGVRSTTDALARISPDQIASVEVMKNDAARAYSSDPAAANGIIKVVTKAAAKAAAR